MSDFIHLKGRLLNQPLLVEPSYAQVLFGALADKLNIKSLIDGENKLSTDDLKDGAFHFNTDRTESKPYAVVRGNAIIPVSGSLVAKTNRLRPYSGMTGYDGIKANLDMALADDSVDQIIFDLDSSGGEVSGCFELSDYIHSKRGNKKMVGLVGNIACSACYAIASACDEVNVSETAIVGSIGVITAHTSVEGEMEKRGIEITLIHAGDHKADGNPYEKLPEEVKGRIQSRLDRIYTMFTTRVATYRGINVDDVIKTQALTYLGSDAIDVGLADNVVSTIDFIENLSQTSGTNINLEETNMSDEHDKALADATATGLKTGATDMQARIKGILASDEAKGRTTLAEHMAYDTSMSVDDSIAMLAKAPKEQVESVEPVDKTKGSGFDAAMQDQGAESVNADGDNNVEEDELSAFLTKIGK